MKIIRMLFTLLVVSLTVTAVSFASDKAKDVTIKGEIIDVKCYLGGMMGGKGPQHEECAIACVKGGLPVGILDEKTGDVYTIVPAKGMKGANEALLPYVAKTVTVKGKVIEKGGSRLLLYSSVEVGK